MVETIKVINKCALRQIITKNVEKENKGLSEGEIAEIVTTVTEKLMSRYADLIPKLIGDIDQNAFNFKTLYDKLKLKN